MKTTKENKIFKKILCLFMTIILIVLTMSPVSAITVNRTEETEKQITTAITKTDTLINSLCKQTENESLSNLLISSICNDETLSNLMVSFYSSMEKNAETMSMLNIDISPKTVAKGLTNFPEIFSKLSSTFSWTEVDLSGTKWNVNNKKEFVTAISAVFSPFNDLLYTLLCSGSYSLNLFIGLKGSNGYETAVIEILKNFGMKNYTPAKTFYADAAKNKNSMVEHIVFDVLTYVEYLCEAPFERICEILPNIAYFIDNDGLDNAISNLIAPLRIKILNIPTIFKIGMFMKSFEQTTNGININANNISSGTNLQISPILLDEIAACGTLVGDKVVADKEDMFIYLLAWIINTVKLNSETIKNEIGDENGEEIQKIINNVMLIPTYELIAFYIELFSDNSGSVNNYEWTFKPFTPTIVQYTPNLDEVDYLKMLLGMDDLIDEIIAEGGEYKTFREAFEKEIYSNKLVSQLVCGIYSMLEEKEIKDLISMLDINVTPKSLANELTEKQFSSTRYTLNNYKYFKNIKAENLNWGFKNGDKDGFINALSAAFRPFEPVLKMLLAEDKITILDSIDFYGSNGYNTAIIPLLEALSCDTKDILTYDEFKEEIKKEDVIKPIITPLVNLIDCFLDSPVLVTTAIVPNLMYFINNNGLENCINNLLYPIFEITNKLNLNINEIFDLSEMTGEVDTSNLANNLLSNIDLGIKLPELDLNQFALMDGLITVESKRTLNGQPVNVSYVHSDQPAVLITALRYLVDIIKSPDNGDILNSFMDTGSLGENDMVGSFASEFITDLEKMTTDETIEWIHGLFFKERPVVEEPVEDNYNPTIIYEENGIKENKSLILSFILLLIIAIIVFVKRDKVRKLGRNLDKENILNNFRKIKEECNFKVFSEFFSKKFKSKINRRTK